MDDIRSELQEKLKHTVDRLKGLGGTVAVENPLWVKFARAMAPMMAPSAAPIAGGIGHLSRSDLHDDDLPRAARARTRRRARPADTCWRWR